MTFLQHAWLKYQVHRLMNGAIGEGETLARGVATCSISNRIEASSSKWRIAAESNYDIDMHLYISGHPGCYPMKKCRISHNSTDEMAEIRLFPNDFAANA